MSATEDLIGRLAAEARPVRRLRPPGLRAAALLGMGVLLVGGLLLALGPRPDLARRLAEPLVLLGWIAAALTAVAGAVAAMLASLPDRSRAWLLLPLPPALAWAGTVGAGCLTAWVGLTPGSVRAAEVLQCLAMLAAVALPLSALLVFLLRHAARLRPTGPLLAGGLAIGAVAALALDLTHAFNASALVLLWNFGAAGVVLAADVLAGRFWLRRAAA
jgi:hypothetical protein